MTRSQPGCSSRKSALHGILAATPQVAGVLFVTPDLKAYRYRRATRRASRPRTGRQLADMRALMAAARPGRRRGLGRAGLEQRAAADGHQCPSADRPRWQAA